MASKSKQPGVSRELYYFDLMPDADVMISTVKRKSIDHAFNKGGMAFINGLSIADCPYKEGLFKEYWLYGYESEQEGLPF